MVKSLPAASAGLLCAHVCVFLVPLGASVSSAQAKLALHPLASVSALALLGPSLGGVSPAAQSPWLFTLFYPRGWFRHGCRPCLGHESHMSLLELQEEGGLLWRKQARNR